MSDNPENQKGNRLIHSTSPYLLQHAYNPVDWYEWGEEALQKSREHGMPILVSIGYSSCHWCHVMERESFENDEIAGLMNEHFVCIKVDREERPDIDQVYMDAVQAMGMNGGWPLNVFLTEEQKPFFGGTYFNPQSWTQLLKNIAQAYETRRNEIEDTAKDLTEHLQKTNIDNLVKSSTEEFKTSIQHSFSILERKFDTRWGGLDRAPKFIMPSIWQWLLRYWYIDHDKSSLDHVAFTLKQIIGGGIYDQLGGGFARYSVDETWFAPHFEKMLYDNAQLISLYSEAYKITQLWEFKDAVYRTFAWLNTEMLSAEGGFYSALDADSEGVEGKFYTWTYDELKKILGDDVEIAARYFGAMPSGNWEHGRNILTARTDSGTFADQAGMSEADLRVKLESIRSRLLKERDKRTRPGLDDKILTSWNAMTIIGLLDAYDAFGDVKFNEAAQRGIHFINNNLFSDGKLYRSHRHARSSTEGFLDDYAYTIKAYIKLYNTDFNESWIDQASSMTKYVVDNFYDSKEQYFHFSSTKSEQLIARRKELFDNVIPSSNSVMAENLFILGTMLDNDWKQMAADMVHRLSHLIASEPVYMSNWGIVQMMVNHGLAEVAFAGTMATEMRDQFAKTFQPFSIQMGVNQSSRLPLLQDKKGITESTIFVCYDKTCKQPVHRVEEAIAQLQ